MHIPENYLSPSTCAVMGVAMIPVWVHAIRKVRKEVPKEIGPTQMGLSEDEVARRTVDMLRLLNIEHLRNRAPYHLSGGEKKKAAIACILSMNPEVLVMDEPLAGLDKQTQEWLLAFLLKLKRSGRTMVIATHNEQLSAALADRRIVFNDRHEARESDADDPAPDCI